jgi:hypothetical protein
MGKTIKYGIWIHKYPANSPSVRPAFLLKFYNRENHPAILPGIYHPENR